MIVQVIVILNIKHMFYIHTCYIFIIIITSGFVIVNISHYYEVWSRNFFRNEWALEIIKDEFILVLSHDFLALSEERIRLPFLLKTKHFLTHSNPDSQWPNLIFDSKYVVTLLLTYILLNKH